MILTIRFSQSSITPSSGSPSLHLFGHLSRRVLKKLEISFFICHHQQLSLVRILLELAQELIVFQLPAFKGEPYKLAGSVNQAKGAIKFWLLDAQGVASAQGFASGAFSTQITMKAAGITNMPGANFLISSFTDGEVTTTSLHFCWLLVVGSHLAASRSLPNESFPIGSSVNYLMLLLPLMASKTSIMTLLSLILWQVHELSDSVVKVTGYHLPVFQLLQYRFIFCAAIALSRRTTGGKTTGAIFTT